MVVVDAPLDPLHDAGSTAATWTTVNAAEAIPGVATPLGWTWFFEPCELGLRGAFADIGAIAKREVLVPANVDERFVGIFQGHFAGNVDMMRRMGDQMPGSSGEAVEEQYFAEARQGLSSARSVRRLPIVLAKLPLNAWRRRRQLRRLAGEIDVWWKQMVRPGSTGDAADARAGIRQAKRHLLRTIRAHTVVSMIGQGLFEQVRRTCLRAGRPGLELRVISGDDAVYETAMISDLWEVSQGRRALRSFLDDHGFHGPAEGELSSRSWREDPSPVEAVMSGYRASAPPRRRGVEERRSAEQELSVALAWSARARARLVLRLARQYIPLRELGRATFLKANDVARCLARRVGEDLALEGALDCAEDVFFLTLDELLGDVPRDARALVAVRRERRERYLRLELPERWVGEAEAIPTAAPSTAADDVRSLTGIGASPGVVEGRASVVVDPAVPGDVRAGDVLVCRTTDPSWASLFFIVAACVIDVGGPMSHGAIVARELGIPCVINTRDGTQRLRSGALLRVDGQAGTVEVLAS